MRNDVLIIGAGPSGLFAAAELARHGVEARLIEREVRPHREARATAIQPGTLEILDSVGLLQPFLDAAEHIRCSRMYGPGMSELGAMSHDGIGCCCEFQCSLPQYETQRILEEHLVSLGGAVERGVTATKVETDADGVVVELVHADGRMETVRPTSSSARAGRTASRATPWASRWKAQPTAAISSSPTSRCRRRSRATKPASSAVPMACCCSRRSPAAAGSVSRIWKRTWRHVSAEDVVARVAATARRQIPPHRRRLVRAVSDAPADRLAPGRRPTLPDRRRRPPFEPVRRRRAQRRPARRPRPRMEACPCPARPCAARRCSTAMRRSAGPPTAMCSKFPTRSTVRSSTPRDAARQRREIHPAVVDPITAALVRNSRAMIDVDYAGSPLVVDYGSGGAGAEGPRPGQWYPDWRGLAERRITCWFSAPSPTPSRSRDWTAAGPSLCSLSRPGVDPGRAGLAGRRHDRGSPRWPHWFPVPVGRCAERSRR